MTQTSGLTNSLKWCNCPGRSIPISRTKISVDGFISKIVTGTPISLLKLACVLCTLNLFDKTAATISLVVVLPLDPVIPTTVGLTLPK